MTATLPDPVERFWSRINKGGPDECWNWDAPNKHLYGYGTVYFRGKSWRSHVLAWTLTNGAIGSGMYVLHQCDNPACCNPAHLRIGTQQENVSDMHHRGRAHIQVPAVQEGQCLTCGAGFVCLARQFRAQPRKFCSYRCSALHRWRKRDDRHTNAS